MPCLARCNTLCIAPSGTPLIRAFLISLFSEAFSDTSKHSSLEPEQLIHEFKIAFKLVFKTFEPATRAATFISSSVFQ